MVLGVIFLFLWKCTLALIFLSADCKRIISSKLLTQVTIFVLSSKQTKYSQFSNCLLVLQAPGSFQPHSANTLEKTGRKQGENKEEAAFLNELREESFKENFWGNDRDFIKNRSRRVCVRHIFLQDPMTWNKSMEWLQSWHNNLEHLVNNSNDLEPLKRLKIWRNTLLIVWP